MVYTSGELYREFNESDEWQQGDIIEGLYITRLLQDDMPIRRSQDLLAKISYVAQLAEKSDEVAPPFSNRYSREYALIPVFKTDVMIVSQTCDIAHDEQVTVARVRPFLDSDKPEFQGNIRRGNVFRAFYLPDYPSNGQESFSTLAEVTVLSKKLLQAYKAKRRISLSPRGLRLFQSFIGRFFGREAMPGDVSKIITTFYRRLKESEVGSKIDRIYYDYSSENISLLVALDDDDGKGRESVEAAKKYTDESIKHRYEIQVECKAKDRIMLREIEGFREFR